MKRALPALTVVVALIMGATSATAGASTEDVRRSLSDAIDGAVVNSRHSYSVPDVTKTITTEDGLSVTLKKQNEHIYRRAPLTTHLFSHEAQITMQGIAEVKGGKPNAEHTLSAGYLVGCQIDASEPIHVKAQLPVRVNPFSPFFGVSENSAERSYENNKPWDQKAKDSGAKAPFKLFGPPKLGLGLGFTSGFSIETMLAYWTVVRPGRIVKVPLSSYSFRGNATRWTDFRNLHLYIDGCPGNVSLRSYVEFVDGAEIPGHYRQKSQSNPKLEARRAPKTPQVKFAQATEKLKRVQNKALKLSAVEPDEKLNGLGESNLDRFSTEKPEDSDEPETEMQKIERELAEIGKPNQHTLTSPYGDGTAEQIEGIKFTIHGAVRWMSTILPQTSLDKDFQNREQNIDSQLAPLRDYSSQVERGLTQQQLDRKTPRPKADRKEDKR